MKKLGIVILILLGLNGYSQTKNQLIKYGDLKFNEGDFYAAAEFYAQAREKDSTDILINLKVADANRLYNNYAGALRYYKYIYKKDRGKTYIKSLYWLAMMYKQTGDYRNAGKMFKKYNRKFRSKKNTYEYKKSLQEIISCKMAPLIMGDTLDHSPENLGEGINTTNSEFSGVLKGDTFFYTSLRSEKIDNDLKVFDNAYKIKIYKGSYQDTAISGSDALDTIINNPSFQNGNGTFSLDYKRFYFSRCDDNYLCDIYYSQLKNGSWSEPKRLNINLEGATETQPHITKIDGSEYLLFSSNRNGGKGKMDIWFSKWNGKEFSRPENAGKNINSIDNEITPFYDTIDGKLYFSSDWHVGLGGFDIFSAKGRDDNFTKPENLGYPINSTANDTYYFLDYTHNNAFLTSNREGSYYLKAPTCCNDIYIVKRVIEIPDEDTLRFKNLVELNKKLPVTLYFHNDEPTPRSWDTTTTINYLNTYSAYTQLKNTYKSEYSSGLEEEERDIAASAIEDFFEFNAYQGVKDLEEFCILLLRELEKGKKIELGIKGFASPLAKTDYNVNLAKRRISSLINYFREYEAGILIKYIEKADTNGSELTFAEIPYGEYIADRLVSDNLNDQKNSVYSVKAALERKIEIVSVQLVEDSIPTAMLAANMEMVDFGTIKKDSAYISEVILTNIGNIPLSLDSLEFNNNQVKVALNLDTLNPKQSAILRIQLLTDNLEGIIGIPVTIHTNGTPEKYIITIIGEKPKPN